MTTPTSVVELRQTPRRQRGFTLLELLIVLALMLLGIGLVIPNVATSASSEFNSQVRQAVSILRYARRVAIVEARPQEVTFHALDRSAGDFAAQQAALLAARQPTDWISDSITLEYQTELNQPAAAEQSISVVFFPQGGSTGGVVDFAQNDRRAQVRIDPITGRIAVAYNGEALDQEALDAAF